MCIPITPSRDECIEITNTTNHLFNNNIEEPQETV